MVRGLALLLIPLAASAAPVPAHLMPRTEVQLRYNPNDHPLQRSFTVTIRNTGGSDLQIWTDRPYGIAAFLDYEVVDANGERVSRFAPWASPPDEGAKVLLRETVEAKKSLTKSDAVFNFLNRKPTPGRYKVRVHFDYKDQHATSDWLEVDISESQIRTRGFVLTP